MSAPVLVLLICLPLLRPLRSPDPRLISDDEEARLATIQAVVENRTLAIDDTSFSGTRDVISVGPHRYSNQPPVLAVLLSGPYWVMHHFGLNFEHDPALVSYLLTLLGVTLPVALGAGLVYRMGRLFELRRPLRAALALIVVLGSGLVSYATVLNAHASAASLLLVAFACLFNLTLTKQSRWGIGWLGVAGVCASLAAVIDPPALIFLCLLFPVGVALNWTVWPRVAGSLAYLLGAAGPIALHLLLIVPITGDPRPGFLHPELALNRPVAGAPLDAASPSAQKPTEDEEEEPPTLWGNVTRGMMRVLATLLGPHGVLSHFPIVIFGVIGVSMVMHRHWPATTKTLAAATVIGSIVVLLVCALGKRTVYESMFATRWFVVFLPLVLFWSGVWMRRPHREAAWATAGILLTFSVLVSLVGATGPFPRGGFDHYSFAGAWYNLRHPPQAPVPAQLADRRDDSIFGE